VPNFKKILLFITVIIAIVLLCGCYFPDNVPELSTLKNFSLKNMDFGKTTKTQFLQMFSPQEKVDIQDYDGEISIATLKSQQNKDFGAIRVGFKKNKLDWVEFSLINPVKISKLTPIYGKPTDVNKNSSTTFDYYNYEFFNISVEKQSGNANAITYFENSPLKAKISTHAKTYVVKKLFFKKFPDIEPGITTEADFSAKYKDLVPYEETNSQTNSLYVMTDELEEAGGYYESAILKFESGLLTWINLIPRPITANEEVKRLGKNYKLENIDANYQIYDFTDFILVVDRKTNQVKSIGIFTKVGNL